MSQLTLDAALSPADVMNRALKRRWGYPEDGPLPWHNMTPKAVRDVAIEVVGTLHEMATAQQQRAEKAEARVSSLQTELAEQAQKHKAELRDLLASLYDDDLHPVSSFIGNDFKAGINHERKLTAKMIELKARELDVWPLAQTEHAEIAPAAGLSPSSQDPRPEPWRAVFGSQEEYDASVAANVAKVESGEVKPISQDLAGAPNFSQVAACPACGIPHKSGGEYVVFGSECCGVCVDEEPPLQKPEPRMTVLPDGHITPPCWPCPGCLADKPSECMGTACVHYHADNQISDSPALPQGEKTQKGGQGER